MLGVQLPILGIGSSADRQESITFISFIAFLSDRTFKIYRGDSALGFLIFPTHHPWFSVSLFWTFVCPSGFEFGLCDFRTCGP